MRRKVLAGLLATTAVLSLSSCASHTSRHHYATVYTDNSGNAYASGYLNGMLVWYLWQPSAGSYSYSSTSNFSGGSWSQVSKPSDPVTATKEVVEQQENGTPEETQVDEATVPTDEVINEDTNPAEIEQQINEPEDNSGVDDNNDAGNVDSGDDGGGGFDSGGGDAGGGE